MTGRIRFASCHTPHGTMLAAVTEHGLCRLLPPGHGLEELHSWAGRCLPGAELVPDPAAAQPVQAQLTAYFAGRLQHFGVTLDLYGTEFQRAVWQAVLAVPFGETRSYAEIAREVGRPSAWRAVGAANAINPVCVVIPCHRIIGADGTLKGYAGGVLSRPLLLAIERRATDVRTPHGRWDSEEPPPVVLRAGTLH